MVTEPVKKGKLVAYFHSYLDNIWETVAAWKQAVYHFTVTTASKSLGSQATFSLLFPDNERHTPMKRTV